MPDTDTDADTDCQFLREAIALSRQHMLAGDGGPFGAVIVSEGKIISRGWNRVTTTNDPTAHAEVTAIRAACTALGAFRLDDCVIYASCEPCPMCLAAIYWARLARLVFAGSREDASRAGFDDEFLYRELPLPVLQRQLPTSQLLRGDAQAVFADWLAKPDRVAY